MKIESTDPTYQKISKLNPTLEIFEFLMSLDEFVLVTARIHKNQKDKDNDDFPHYLVINSKYGVIEGSWMMYLQATQALKEIAQQTRKAKEELEAFMNGEDIPGADKGVPKPWERPRSKH